MLRGLFIGQLPLALLKSLLQQSIVGCKKSYELCSKA